jgi:hypothetical protein
VKVVGFVVALEAARERTALDVDIGIAAVHVLVGGADRDLVVEAVLNSGAEAELLVQRQVRAPLAFRHRRAVVAAADRPQPAFGERVLGAQRNAPGVVVVQVGRLVGEVEAGGKAPAYLGADLVDDDG